MQLSIVIPTFREAENLPVLIPQVCAALEGADIEGEIVVVDDNSCDGSEEICRELAQQYPVRFHVRTTERGLSSAVIAGIDLAEGEVVLVMDADLSHPPEKIPELYAALDGTGNDFVIGSRYVAGGGTADDWGLFRWLNSKVATLLARPFTDARDPMAGFFAVRRSDVLHIREHLDPIGYKIGLELLVKCRCRNVVEVPIYFSDRLHGESKLSLKEQLNYLRHLKRLYDYRYPLRSSLLQFLAVGASGLVVDLLLFALLQQLWSANVARAVAIWGAMSWNFLGNRTVTFSRARDTSWPVQYFAFCASCLVGAAINWGVSVGLWETVVWFTDRKILAAAIGVLAGTASNYLLSRFVVFRQGFRAGQQESGGADGTAADKEEHHVAV